MRSTRWMLAAALVAVMVVSGCGGSGTSGGSAHSGDTNTTPEDSTPATVPSEPGTDTGDSEYAPVIDPADFVETIDNPYVPYRKGARWVYEGRTDEGVERIDVTVQAETKTVMGVVCTVVRDTVTIDGVLVEDTLDWFAQDKDGNVWYFGEDVKNYENGEVVDTEGAWEAGVDGALPGIIMMAEPTAGTEYRQEYYAGEAEDMGKVVQLDGRAEVPFGAYENVLVTDDWTPLEPDVLERKYYAKDVGMVLEETLRGGEGRIELIDFAPPSDE